MNRWVVAAQQVRLDVFIHLTHPQGGLTGMDAAELARDELFRYGGTIGGGRHRTWQEAWNAMSGATSTRPGQIVVTSPRCRECHGRGFSFSGRAMSAAMGRGMPQGTCPDCRGSGRGDTVRIVAAYVPEPDPADTVGQR